MPSVPSLLPCALRRATWPAVALLLAATLAETAPASTAGLPPTSTSAVQAAVARMTPAELELLRLTNEYRASLRLEPLLVSARLQREARWYAADMAEHDGFTITHVDSLGRDLWDRLGYFNYEDEDAAQNSGTGSPSGAEMFAALKASPAHDRTMRGAAFRVTSVAVAENPDTAARWYWAATFGTINDRPSFEAVIAVPARPRLLVARCRGGRALLLRASANAARRAIEVQPRRHGRWQPVRHIAAARACVALRAHERLRARAVAYPDEVEGADRGTWRLLRGRSA